VRRQKANTPARFVTAPAGKIAQRQFGDAFDEFGLGEIRPADQRAARAHHRLVRAVEPAQRGGAVGEELRVVGRHGQRLVVARKRLGGTIELDQRIAAIAERFEMIGDGGEHALEIIQRLLRPTKLEQRHATPVEQLGVVRRKAQAFVVALERAFELLERVKDEAEA
jgi:hypothetical protein